MPRRRTSRALQTKRRGLIGVTRGVWGAKALESPSGPEYPYPKEVAPHLPSGYGVDLIVLQTRDPWWLYAYWELTSSTVQSGIEKLRSKAGQAQRTLRVYEEESSEVFDIAVTPEAFDWYIEVGTPDRSFWVEIGLKAPDGRFLALARSNKVRTPRYPSAFPAWQPTSQPVGLRPS